MKAPVFYRIAAVLLLRFSLVRSRSSVAAGWSSGRELWRFHAPYCLGAGYLLRRDYSFELEIRLHHPHRFLKCDYGVFDCRSMALAEAELKPRW